MFITNHVAIGILVAELMPTHPFLAFLIAFFFHFVADIIPHGDTHLYDGYVDGTGIRKALAITSIDASVAILLVAYILAWHDARPALTISMGIAGGVLPDILVALFELTKSKLVHAFHTFHFRIHNAISLRTGDLSLRAGFVLESVVLVVVLHFLQ